MSIFTLLGFGTNWDRVDRMRLKESLWQAGIVVKEVTHLEYYDYDMEIFFTKCYWKIKKEWAYKVILAFGEECPTRTEYNKFTDFSSTMDLLPSARKLRKNPALQQSWDVAYAWAVQYNKHKTETILAEKEKKNVDLELELKTMKAKIARYKEQIEISELDKKNILAAKDRKIAKLKEILAKKNLKINQLKRKKSYQEFKKNQIEEIEFEASEEEEK
ncbi:hypothetical protein [Spiroplasma platyhelix]|uniref:Uncharacterized protein n=1 Tax=Spiroplasma platyhelix PALS-1 TaxID=1276218 RepID=A0A846TTG2_9MOLU|nr:hypothetical protein [Spiroplasma platyhelix]MBE4704425.1 hypothetical protein [Spiroplasma platyhelix PALS-1]NKE38795.1 hypothetical protein [Spiroplasma platyhelix PALS-1]UJB29007.1 hypothetical protein SPLAT_v1c02430 [Spiroplasma platyhelix PALS-1]